MKIRDHFSELATRAGLAADDAKLTATLEALGDIDIDDELAGSIGGALITESEAETRPTIKNKLRAEALNGIDSVLDPVLKDFLDEAEIAAASKSGKTSQKLTKLIEKARALKQSGGSSEETAKTIQQLNEQILQLKEGKDTEINTLKQQQVRERFYDRYALRLAGRADVVETAKDDDCLLVVRALERKLDSVGGVIDYATGNVMKKDEPTDRLYISNKPVTVDGLTDEVLKERKYIKQSQSTPTNIIDVDKDKGDKQETPAERNAREREERRKGNG